MKSDTVRLVIGISGASGVMLGIRMLEYLRSTEYETHLVISPAAKLTISEETNWDIEDVTGLADKHYKHTDIGAAIASGAFTRYGMAVMPCSIKTLSAVANSYSSDLIARAADVTLKEGKPLLLGVRESPLHSGHLKLMSAAEQVGAIIFPPVPAFYSRPTSIEELVDNIVGRALLRLGIENDLYSRWRE